MSIPESHLAQEAIAALVDGELPPGPAGRAARHLSRCAQCRMAVAAQQEAKDALHECAEVAVPGDLLSRLVAIPFSADVPGSSGLGTLRAGAGELTVDGGSGGWSVDLRPQDVPPRPGTARWLRRGVAGTVAGLGLGVTLMALTLPGSGPDEGARGTVAGPTLPEERTEVVPPPVRTFNAGTASVLSVPGPGGTP
ncbi:anti-sigma factor family protein [Geodermatophilus sp. YIM 151500]|uniref:anti-sigma factor family protein n=1 Tax=Geodermatophilus sp. YIM 151500 TaxID=2984531 RepID=UPI002962534B|nr:zf-HC2 domain-containing protein [Geodermatophilus sp. YIM 151500]